MSSFAPQVSLSRVLDLPFAFLRMLNSAVSWSKQPRLPLTTISLAFLFSFFDLQTQWSTFSFQPIQQLYHLFVSKVLENTCPVCAHHAVLSMKSAVVGVSHKIQSLWSRDFFLVFEKQYTSSPKFPSSCPTETSDYMWSGQVLPIALYLLQREVVAVLDKLWQSVCGVLGPKVTPNL